MSNVATTVEGGNDLHALFVVVVVEQPARGFDNDERPEEQETAHNALQEQGQAPRGVRLNIRACIVDPDRRGVADNVASELDASKLTTVMGRRNLRLVDGDNCRQKADANAGDCSSKKHRPEPESKGLNSAAKDKDERAVEDGFSAANDVADASHEQRRDQSADFQNGHHGADLGTRGLVEVVQKVGGGDDARHYTLIITEQKHAKRHEDGGEIEQRFAREAIVKRPGSHCRRIGVIG